MAQDPTEPTRPQDARHFTINDAPLAHDPREPQHDHAQGDAHRYPLRPFPLAHRRDDAATHDAGTVYDDRTADGRRAGLAPGWTCNACEPDGRTRYVSDPAINARTGERTAPPPCRTCGHAFADHTVEIWGPECHACPLPTDDAQPSAHEYTADGLTLCPTHGLVPSTDEAPHAHP